MTMSKQYPPSPSVRPPPPASRPPEPPPPSYAAALEWLDAVGGALVTTRERDGDFLVSVGLLGRSAEATSGSMQPAELERAFLEAVGLLRTKL
jgi:hypothetical protein